MKIPKHVTVKGVKYKVVIEADLKNERGEALDGYCNKLDKVIKIDAALKNGKDRDNTYIHEVFHAILYEAHVHEVFTEGIEEIVVQNLSRYITDNYMLVPRKKTK
mgnify:CR=1 FL=1